MASDLDLRGMNKVALSMLKSGDLMNKTIKHNFNMELRTKLSSNHNDDDSNTINSFNQSSSIISEQMMNSISKPGVKKQIFKKAEEIFKYFSQKIVDGDAENNHFKLPSSQLQNALDCIFEQKLLKTEASKNVIKIYSSQRGHLFSYKEFKILIQALLNPIPYLNKYSQSPPKVPNSFELLMEQQQQANYFETGIVPENKSIQTPKQSSISLLGKNVPANILKDTIIQTIRKEDSVLRMESKSPSSSRKISFSDSIYSSLDMLSPNQQKINQKQLSPLHQSSSMSAELKDLYNSMSEEDKKDETFIQILYAEPEIDQIEKKKVFQLINHKESYPLKWKQMKQKRDERIDRETRRKERAEALYNYRRRLYDSQKHETKKVLEEQQIQRFKELESIRKDAQDKKDRLKQSLRLKTETALQKKKVEVNYVKSAIKSNLLSSKLMNQFDSDMRKTFHIHSGMSHGDDSSTLIDIPEVLHERLRTAKSLNAYEAARQDIKTYYENTIDRKIKNYTASREQAKLKAQLFGANLAIKPLSGADYFNDSINLSEFGDDSEEKSLDRHRGAIRASGGRDLNDASHYVPRKIQTTGRLYKQAHDKDEAYHRAIQTQQFPSKQFFLVDDISQLSNEMSFLDLDDAPSYIGNELKK